MSSPPRPRERLFALEQFGIKLGLDNITALVEALGRPDRRYPTVHIAGTNGKGSVAAMVERGLRAAGHTTGRYTSPHLALIEERVAIDGASIDAPTFDRVTSEVLALIDRLRAEGVLPHLPTFFETTTAMAFEIFKQRSVTAAVIEVGLGGRFDATNVITPAVTAITSIARDHERHLGHSLEEIAFEKAGIIKAGVPVVVGPMAAGPRRVIEEAARARQAPMVAVDSGGPVLRPPATLALRGAHQVDNAAVAAAVLRLCGTLGRPIADEHVATALTDVMWPARLEWVQLADGGRVLFDAAHNPAGAAAFAAYVRETTGPLPLVLGFMKDKDVVAMLQALLPVASRIVATQADTPRALEARALADQIARLAPAIAVDCHDAPEAAVAAALAETTHAAVAGSIFLVGPLRHALIAGGATPVRYSSKASPMSTA